MAGFVPGHQPSIDALVLNHPKSGLSDLFWARVFRPEEAVVGVIDESGSGKYSPTREFSVQRPSTRASDADS